MIKTKPTDRIYFPHLDVVRGLAAFMIIIVHAYADYIVWFNRPRVFVDSTDNVNVLGELVEQFIHNLNIGVDIFFLISGFLITYILIEERNRFGRINIKNFIIRRSLRIWPLYFLIIAITPLLVYWVDRPHPNYLMNLFFLGNFDVIRTTVFEWPLAHYWTICVEEHFYIFWPFIVAFVPRRFMLNSMLMVVAASMLFRLYSYFFIEGYQLVIYLHTLSRLDALAMGAIGGYIYSVRPFTFKITTRLRGFLIIAFLVLMCTDSVHSWLTPFDAVFKKYIYLVILAVLLLDFNFNPSFKHSLKGSRFLHYLGKISYGIYMYGNITILFVTQRIMFNNNMDNIFLYFAFIIILPIIVATISYEFFEKPLLKLKRKFSKIKTAH